MYIYCMVHFKVNLVLVEELISSGKNRELLLELLYELVQKYVFKMNISGEFFENVHIAYLKLLEVLPKYDPDRARFSTFAYIVCRNAVLKQKKVSQEKGKLFDKYLLNKYNFTKCN
jgi:DNA-directed RNA polymerase specialized sigma subunit